MYSKECVVRRIKAMGPIGFIDLISSSDFPMEIKEKLEEYHIFTNGEPCREEIYRLAA